MAVHHKLLSEYASCTSNITESNNRLIFRHLSLHNEKKEKNLYIEKNIFDKKGVSMFIYRLLVQN